MSIYRTRPESGRPFRVSYATSALATFLMTLLTNTSVIFGQYDFERSPISYRTASSNDAIAQLIKKIGNGKVKLEWDDTHGWLPSLLDSLKVSPDSQTLVFSKTSLQARHISPRNPRALYFSDDVYVGAVPGGDLIELAAIDNQLGPVFYSIDQKPLKDNKLPQINRDQTQCLTCHATTKTQNVPGFLVRSVYASGSGHPHYGLGTQTTDHTTAFKNRFGGWYVTGQHGSMRHRGNQIARNDPRDPLDYDAGANLSDLPDKVDPKNYLRDTSDLVALMLLEYQSQMHNALTAANYETRKAYEQQAIMNEALGRPEDFKSDSTKRRIKAAGEKVLELIFFADEFELESPVKGSSSFAEHFEKQGPKDSQGRTLRQFDLKTRLFKYRCSFYVYSDSFDALPKPMLDYVENRICEILYGKDSSTTFSHLSSTECQAIREMLIETKPSLAARLKAYPK